jgi:hypothetical protein
MKTLHFPPTKVSHTSKTPRSKSLEPDRLAPLPAIATQSQGEEDNDLYPFRSVGLITEGWGDFKI